MDGKRNIVAAWVAKEILPPVPIGSSQQQANTFPSTYDALGAEYFVGFKVRF